MKRLRFILDDKIRNSALWIDYILYLLLNPFKFKQFPKEVRRILVVELLEIGDLIVATPVIRTLKENYPNSEIDVLVLPSMTDVISGNKNISEIISYDNNLISKLKQKDYDLGIILHPGSFKISLALFNGKVKYRIGCVKAGTFYGKGFFLNKKIRPNTKIQHKVEDNLDVIRSIVKTIIKKPEIFTDKLVKNKNYVVIHPGAKFITHNWISERFAEVADYIANKYKKTIVFTGSKKDDALIKNIQGLMKNKSINSVGTTIKQFFAIIKNADLVLSVDTGAMHVAATFNKPVIALFGAGIPDVWYPYTEKRTVIFKDDVCVSCLKAKCTNKINMECMKAITVSDVIKEADEFLR
ncbi:glycosyltransferase family 9 protein [Candidatus Woesearchaeota archaeon]|nr:glycosyltransferase family 9 protein [Candidatus Woesearchaeota archaeon]